MSRRPKHTSPIPLILAGAGLILIALAGWILLPGGTSPSPTGLGASVIPGEVRYPSPELELTDLHGAPVSLADYRGRVVLVNNWATWCPPCRAEMPELETYFRAHQEEGFVLLGINSGDTQEQVSEFVQAYDLTFPMWLDPTGKALTVFGTNALPSSFVIDRKGIVRLAWTGGIDAETLETYVTPLLKE